MKKRTNKEIDQWSAKMAKVTETFALLFVQYAQDEGLTDGQAWEQFDKSVALLRSQAASIIFAACDEKASRGH